MKILISVFLFCAFITSTFASSRYVRISVDYNKRNLTKEYACFDTTVKDYGTRKQIDIYGREYEGNYNGIVRDHLCEDFERIYEIGIIESSEGFKVACFEFDKKRIKHKSIKRIIDEYNKDTAPCNESLVYTTKRISKDCGNHHNCKISVCHLDVYNERGRKLLTRPLYSNDVIDLNCFKLELGNIITEDGNCYEYDLNTNGKKHFFSCGDVGEDILMTKYELLRPDDTFVNYLGSFAFGKKCFEIDELGGEVYKKEVETEKCNLLVVDDKSRSTNLDSSKQVSDKTNRIENAGSFKE